MIGNRSKDQMMPRIRTFVAFGLAALCGAAGLPAQIPDPYGDWKTKHGVVTDLDDGDGDLIPAIAEYYGGTSPVASDALPVSSIHHTAPDEVRIALKHDPSVGDVKAQLMEWLPGGWESVSFPSLHNGQSDTHSISLLSRLKGIFRFQYEPGMNGHFLSGADISSLAKIENQGGVFKKDGVPGDAIGILRNEGVNLFRIRIFLAPDGSDVVVNDLAYTLALAARIKAANAGLLLDFHYSDTWADPAHQTKPAAWSALDFEALEAEVESYTSSVIAALAAQGTAPDIVQIGNEVTSGMLWDTGKLYVGNHAVQWQRFTDLLMAGIRGARAANPPGHCMKIMIHIDRGTDWGSTEWFYSQMEIHNVEYDIIGLSYYPWWHGTMADVATNFHNASRRFRKPMLMVETAYPHKHAGYWENQPNMAWPITEAGQAAFLRELADTVRQSAGGYGMGVVYWYPEAITVPGLSVWNGGATALFGSDGEVYAGAAAMEPTP